MTDTSHGQEAAPGGIWSFQDLQGIVYSEKTYGINRLSNGSFGLDNEEEK